MTFPWWFYIILGFIFALLVLAILLEPQKRPFRYLRKNHLMTRAERDCYEKLLSTVGNTYYVFPQIHLPNLIDHKVKGQGWRRAFAYISQKSVDFVLCTKAEIAPVLAIELDDSSHERPDRIVRDLEVERMLKDAGMPLLRLKHGESIDILMVERAINGASSESRPTSSTEEMDVRFEKTS